MPFLYLKPVYFVGDSDVPYISLEDWAELYPYLLKTYVHKGDEELEYGLAYTRDGNVGTLSRTDGDPYTMTVDCDEDTITFFDYDAFIRLEADRVLIDILEADSSHSDEEISLFRRAEGCYERYGDPLVLDAGAYGIDLVADENGVYVPMQQRRLSGSLWPAQSPAGWLVRRAGRRCIPLPRR